jgi:hypothetical protein
MAEVEAQVGLLVSLEPAVAAAVMDKMVQEMHQL